MAAPFLYTDLRLPQTPFANPAEPTYQDLLYLYNAVIALATQIDTVLTLSQDVRVDDATRGLILKDTQATPHYWRVTVSTVGALVVTDIGTALPTS